MTEHCSDKPPVTFQTLTNTHGSKSSRLNVKQKGRRPWLTIWLMILIWLMRRQVNVDQFVKTFNIVRPNFTLYLINLISELKLNLPFYTQWQSNGSTLLLLWAQPRSFFPQLWIFHSNFHAIQGPLMIFTWAVELFQKCALAQLYKLYSTVWSNKIAF